MTAVTTIENSSLPATLPAYLKALRSGGKLSDGETIPRIEASATGIDTDPGRLRKYREVCGFSDSDRLPATFPHILAFPLHMQMLTSKAFPLRLLGLVHVRNSITQHRPIKVNERLDVKTWVDGHRDVHNGIEFDMLTEVHDEQGELVWDEVSTNLSRGKGKGKKPKRNKQDETLELGRYASFRAESNIGRRYASVSGDVNPIHMTALSAKLFGFPRAIAHGMWSLARCAAELEEEYLRNAFDLTVAFRQPVLLPGEVVMKYSEEDSNRVVYKLNKADGSKTHLQGEVRQR